MLTPVQDDLLVVSEDDALTFAEAWARETRRERLVRLIAEIAAPIADRPRNGIDGRQATPEPDARLG